MDIEDFIGSETGQRVAKLVAVFAVAVGGYGLYIDRVPAALLAMGGGAVSFNAARKIHNRQSHVDRNGCSLK